MFCAADSRQKWVKIESEVTYIITTSIHPHNRNQLIMRLSLSNIHVKSFPACAVIYRQAHTQTLMSCLSFIGDKARNTWHLIISKRECEWNIWEIYLHASHLPDSLKSHTQSSALLSAQRITQTVCMNNGHTLNPRCVAGKKERTIKRENENWSRCRGQTTETRGGQNRIITCVIEDSF